MRQPNIGRGGPIGVTTRSATRYLSTCLFFLSLYLIIPVFPSLIPSFPLFFTLYYFNSNFSSSASLQAAPPIPQFPDGGELADEDGPGGGEDADTTEVNCAPNKTQSG